MEDWNNLASWPRLPSDGLNSGRFAPCAAAIGVICQFDATNLAGLGSGLTGLLTLLRLAWLTPHRHACYFAVGEFDDASRGRVRHGAPPARASGDTRHGPLR